MSAASQNQQISRCIRFHFVVFNVDIQCFQTLWMLEYALPFRSLSTINVNPVVRGWSTYSNFGRLFSTANASLFDLVFSAGETDTYQSTSVTTTRELHFNVS